MEEAVPCRKPPTHWGHPAKQAEIAHVVQSGWTVQWVKAVESRRIVGQYKSCIVRRQSTVWIHGLIREVAGRRVHWVGDQALSMVMISIHGYGEFIGRRGSRVRRWNTRCLLNNRTFGSLVSTVSVHSSLIIFNVIERRTVFVWHRASHNIRAKLFTEVHYLVVWRGGWGISFDHLYIHFFVLVLCVVSIVFLAFVNVFLALR